MGGRGSGRRASAGVSADKCNDYHSIDIAWLRRHGLAQIGRWSTLRWSRGGRETGSIQIQYLDHGLRLVYRHGRGDNWTGVDEIVPFIATSPRLGGLRLWFSCLSCQRRCRILYGGEHFRCRLCHGLKYETQYEPAFARAATRALKIRERLRSDGGIDDVFPKRPKGMHHRTYERLREQELRLQSVWASGLLRRFGNH